MAGVVDGLARRAPQLAARAQRQSSVVPAVLLSFLVGIVIAALAIPSHSSTRAGSLLGGSGPGSGGTALAGGPGGSGPSDGSSSVSSASGGGAAATGAAGAASTGGAQAASGSASGASGGPASSTGGTTGSSGGAVQKAGATSYNSTNNGGATASGVTGSAITIGVAGGDSSGLQAICPRCGQGGQQTDKDELAGLIALWHKEGKLPLYGRDINPVFAEGQDLSAETFQAACEQLMGSHPFVAVNPAGGSDAGVNCETQQYHVPALEASNVMTDGDLSQDYPLAWEVGPPLDRVLTNWADWLNYHHLLAGHVLGIYSPADSSTAPNAQEVMNLFRAELKKLGYTPKSDYVYNGTGSADDAVAATQMKNAGVNEVLVFAALTEPGGFQNQASQIGFHPIYPMVDAGYSFTDAVASVSYNAAQQDGNIGMAQKWWQWTARNPATPLNNAAAAECLQAYENQTHANLDVYNDDAKIRYLLDECSDLDVMYQAMKNAGPDLTVARFIGGIEQIQNLQVPEYEAVSFTNNPLNSGGLYWADAKFNAAHWQPENDYIRITGQWTPWFKET